MGRAGLHGMTKTGTTRGAASSGPDHAHEQARSGGRIRHTKEDGTLRIDTSGGGVNFGTLFY